MITEHWSGTWVDKLPSIRIALNAMVHSSTGMTPFKLWMSRAEDLVIPSDLMYDTPHSKVPICPTEYITGQQEAMQRVFEIA